MTGSRGGPALQQRPTGRPVTVLTSGREPEWVRTWSRSTGRAVCAAAVPELEPAAAAVSELAARAARHGSTILLVHQPDTPHPQRRVVVAVRRLPEDGPVVAEAAQCAASLDARLELVHAVPTSFAEKSVGLADALDHGRTVLALTEEYARQVVPGLEVDARLVRARPHEVVGERLDADLLVLGGPRRGTDGALGLVALSALHHAPCSVLLVPRGSGWDDRVTDTNDVRT
ncbi:universal stress protein [Pseudonocardia sp. CA-107938]|uniref:universal stress protein n=1 Tax=Pseudonocardia sp. CA-107938 TaxID=3240021 RepID=UPI003D8EF2C2